MKKIETDIENIRIVDRHRKDFGDLDALATSIKDRGLLQPVVLNKYLRLIAGERRIEAFKRLGRTRIDAVVCDDLEEAAAIIQAERDENTCRKDFAPSEAVSLGKSLETLEREDAEKRIAAGRKKGGDVASGKVARKPGATPEKRTRDVVGVAVGMSGKTYQKAKAVVEAATKEPEKFGSIKEQMDRTGKIDGAFKKLKEQTKPRPAKTYPASDRFSKAMRELAGDLELILQEYGGVAAMLAHQDWNPAETFWAKQFVAAFSKTFQELERELQNA